ncbi:MAG TPA: BamA/TamA family outer membrane protein [Vicinamibacterales bacterium]|nr:BamA/TamA family outer membrane protein [Vicinamibacterales bacterium]
MSRALVVALFVVGLAADWASGQDLRTDEGPEQQPITTGGTAVRTTAGLFTEPRLLTSAIDAGFERFGETGTPTNGPYVELTNMITGSGWISVGPGYRHNILNGSGFVDVSGAVSWHAYTMMQGRIEFPNLLNRTLSVGGQVMWQDETQIDYWGIGSNSLESNQSQYQMQNVDSVMYATVYPTTSLSLTGEFGFLRSPNILQPGGTFGPSVPSTQQLFPLNPGVSEPFQPNYAHSEVALMSDTRDHRSRPTEGGMYRAALTTFVDQSTSVGTFSFREYEAEGAQFLPLTEDRSWVLALHAWAVWCDVPPGHQVPFYLLPALGGSNTLRSYQDYRFHDQNMAVANVESRWAIFTHVDVALFVDAGNVAPQFQDLNFAKRSYGGGIRFHTDETTFARVDVAYGAEGWGFVFRTNDPFRFARLTRRVAPAPFVD